MKILVCAVFAIAAVAGEPPRYRFAKFGTEKESESVLASRRNEEAPYPAAGFRPPAEFVLPSRQEILPPATSYGFPTDSYRAPFITYLVPRSLDTEYGPPSEKSEGAEGCEEKKEGGEEKVSEEKEGDKKEGEAEELKEGEEKDDKDGAKNKEEEGPKEKEDESKDGPDVITTGAYYILLPNSQLQRVQYRTEDDLANMAYTAKLQYSNEGRAPLYVYSPIPAPVPEYGIPESSAYVQWY